MPRLAFVPPAVLAVLLAGCATVADPTWVPAGAPAAVAPTPAVETLPPRAAPKSAYPVRVRQLDLRRDDRALRTTVWYPARGGAVAPGRFPVVVFSHGLSGLPDDYHALMSRWAAAGFIVVAPTYPNTRRGARLRVSDVTNQPADASFVLGRVLALDGTAGDPFRGHLDARRVAAAGHSAGAITTVGLFTEYRDARLRAGVVLAGNGLGMGRAFTGAPAWLLFVHGAQDPLVPYATGQAAYRAVPWPKAFLSFPKERHIDPYLRPETAAFRVAAAVTTDFLRSSLYGDPAAVDRLNKDRVPGGISSLEILP